VALQDYPFRIKGVTCNGQHMVILACTGMIKDRIYLMVQCSVCGWVGEEDDLQFYCVLADNGDLSLISYTCPFCGDAISDFLQDEEIYAPTQKREERKQ
jgi:hypothetical protein